MKKRFSKSIRKYIRREKARIRREILDVAEQGKLIDQLYQRFSTSNPNKENKISQEKK